MERIDQYAFYELGEDLSLLGRYHGDVHPTHLVGPAHLVRMRLESLLAGNPIVLGVSKARCEKLLAAFHLLANSIFDEGGAFQSPTPESPVISAWCFDWYRTCLEEFRTVFSEELKQTHIYYVPTRGIYHTPSLVERADAAFPSEIVAFIPEKAKEDWRAAGRCLAFNLLSASGFHVARAAEGALESYYRCFIGREPPAGLSWGDLIVFWSRLHKTRHRRLRHSPFFDR